MTTKPPATVSSISIHVPREGHDKPNMKRKSTTMRFQSTCPARGTTRVVCAQVPGLVISIHVPREGHDLTGRSKGGVVMISIHVPREGHDYGIRVHFSNLCNFNPRAPRGARLIRRNTKIVGKNFNPRAPRGARLGKILAKRRAKYFNPRAPRGARPFVPSNLVAFTGNISIHVPREGHDACRQETSWSSPRFQSTCPARGTTATLIASVVAFLFQSTCPARGTTSVCAIASRSSPFQSTCPARGTTAAINVLDKGGKISIHVPREGHDTNTLLFYCISIYFNPRAPRGARPTSGYFFLSFLNFNPRAPRGARPDPNSYI